MQAEQQVEEHSAFKDPPRARQVPKFPKRKALTAAARIVQSPLGPFRVRVTGLIILSRLVGGKWREDPNAGALRA